MARRDPGPVCEPLLETPLEKLAPELAVPDWEKDWSRPSDREANKELLPAADFTQVPGAGHFIALERPDVLANLLNAVAEPSKGA